MNTNDNGSMINLVKLKKQVREKTFAIKAIQIINFGQTEQQAAKSRGLYPAPQNLERQNVSNLEEDHVILIDQYIRSAQLVAMD